VWIEALILKQARESDKGGRALWATPRLVAIVSVIIVVVVVGVTFGSDCFSLYRSSPQKTAPTSSDP
jgi:hypothetical protein